MDAPEAMANGWGQGSTAAARRKEATQLGVPHRPTGLIFAARTGFSANAVPDNIQPIVLLCPNNEPEATKMTVARRALVAGFCGLSASLLVARAAAAAAPLAPPTQKPVLTVSGAIGVKNVGETAVFDMPALESLGLTSFSTSTPWDEGKVTYEGVLLSTLLDRLQANGKTLVAIALNDYAAELPIADFAKYGTLLATKRNGKYMPVSDKGPLFIIYPFDSDPNLKQQTYYGRSAWQVNKLVVK